MGRMVERTNVRQWKREKVPNGTKETVVRGYKSVTPTAVERFLNEPTVERLGQEPIKCHESILRVIFHHGTLEIRSVHLRPS